MRTSTTVQRLRIPRVDARGAVAVACLVLGVLGSTNVRGAPPAGGRDAEESAGAVFARVAAAFEDGDAGALAALVHREGLRVTGHNERSGDYSPSQAVYFFRNLFQSHRTLLFAFRKTQDDASGGYARGMADWKRRRIDSERVVEQQLLLVLTQDDGRWRLTEINMIR